MKRILVLEDDAIIAHSIQLHLESAKYDVALATDPIEAKRLFETSPFDLVLSDINLKHPIDGISFAKEVVQGKVPVVFLTAYGDNQTLERAELAFPYAYILKPFHKAQLLLTLKMSLIHAKKRFLHTNEPKTHPVNNIHLSAREIEIVQLLAQSKTSEDIANLLCISVQTVSTHRKNIIRKTGAQSVIELISLAVEKGWI